MDISLIATGVIIGLLVGWAIGSLRAGSRLEHLRIELLDARDQLGSAREELLVTRGHVERLEAENDGLTERASHDSATLQALAPIARKIADVDSVIRDLERRNSRDLARLSEQVTNDALITRQLAHTTESLHGLMRNSSVRGSWGEVQLRRIVEAAGMVERVDFDTQTASSTFANHSSAHERKNASRPDAIIHLPGDGHICIDAKVPMSAYIQAHEIPAVDSQRSEERQALLAEHARAVKAHIAALAKRNYPADFPQSPQLTVMFLPIESLLSQALESEPTLLDAAFNSGIILATPSTLMGLLRSIGSVWRSASASEDARDILATGRELVDRLATVASHMSTLGNALASSVKAYNRTVGSLESRVLPTLRRFDSLDPVAGTLSLPANPVIDDGGQVRDFTSPEFTSREQGDEAME